MEAELKSLRIDRSRKRSDGPSRWATVWILTGIGILLLLGAGRFAFGIINRATDVDVMRVRAATAGDPARSGDVILNATGYVVTAHKIELAAKVVGKVAWIGVEKADHVQQGQELVRLEDEEYKAQVLQATGNLTNLQAQLDQLLHGSRPEEIAKAKADVENARVAEINAKVTLDRTRPLVEQGVMTKQNLDDAQAKYDSALAQRSSLERSYDLIKLGPRQEQIDAARGMVEQAKGQLAYSQLQLDNTVIRAPVTGTILERNVEKGEFVTTGFVGDKGAKGYVVSMADLNDLKVELDINQNDFAKLGPRQRGVVTTDAFPDRHYEGYIDEVSPEANRQKATVQVKVKIAKPDVYLRPEMNASVAFIAEAKKTGEAEKPSIVIPTSAVREGGVFVVSNGRAVRRPVKAGSTGPQGVRIDEGLIGGEDLIVSPPADLKDGDRVKPK
ncbi:MAG TPA: efflux RND transporter periplasmic adaptor subunit [Bryobacteraceae bacterium]|nr:efflux RND transporter periplasmic adaptor subunit [Bryobacteraceae bacterium]